MDLSIVTTIYNSENYVEEFYRRAVAAAGQCCQSFEIIFVNDGSPDGSLAKLANLHAHDPRVVVVDLSRNFGHHRAMMVGLSYAIGRLVFLIDSDLEEEPELLNRFLTRMHSENCDVVFGIQETRRGTRTERLSGAVFYWIIDRLADIKLPRNLITARLMSQRYVRSLLLHREREIVIAGLWVVTGYHQVAETVRKNRHRATNYGLAHKITLAIDYATAFSGNLLYYVMYLGIGVSGTSFFALTYLVVRYLFFGGALEGWTSLIASIWLFGGLSILFIGLVGIYVARIFNETKQRPYAIVRQVLGRSDTKESEMAL